MEPQGCPECRAGSSLRSASLRGTVAVSAGSARCVPCSPPPQGPQEALLCVQVLRKARAGVHALLLYQEIHPSHALQIPEDSLSAQPGGDLANAVLQQGLSAAPGLPTALLGAGRGSVQKGMRGVGGILSMETPQEPTCLPLTLEMDGTEPGSAAGFHESMLLLGVSGARCPWSLQLQPEAFSIGHLKV